MTGQSIIDAMNKADPKKPIKGPQVWFNWKRNGLRGFDARPEDDEDQQ